LQENQRNISLYIDEDFSLPTSIYLRAKFNEMRSLDGGLTEEDTIIRNDTNFVTIESSETGNQSLSVVLLEFRESI